MSAPLVWIVAPGLLGGLLYTLRRWSRAMVIAGIGFSLLLAWLAWQLPIGQPISLGPWQQLPRLLLGDTLSILGRRLVLDDSTRPALIFVYLGAALWFGGAAVARTHRLFIPQGLLIAALLVASMAVEPFLYAALLIEVAALVSVAVLSPPGHSGGRGVLRFLVFQTLGMPFILLAGWMLEGAGGVVENSVLLVRTAALMGMGFAFFMAIFPFHTWIPMVAEDAHPYAAAFVFFVLPGVVALFGLKFLNQYPWLSEFPILETALRFMGVVMVVTGGVWASFQRHLGRILGYTVTVEIGYSLLALSLSPGDGGPLQGLFFAQMLPRGVALAVWALALAVIQNHALAGKQPAAAPEAPASEQTQPRPALLPAIAEERRESLRFRYVQGLARRLPAAAAALALAQFSLAGFPLLAGFPVRAALWTALAQQSLPAAVLALLGSAGVLASGLRSLAVMIMAPEETPWQRQEKRTELALLALGGLALFAIGLLPQVFLPPLANMARIFAAPGP